VNTGLLEWLILLGQLTRGQGDYLTARWFFQECETVSRELNSHHWIAVALSYLGLTAVGERDLDTTRSPLGDLKSVHNAGCHSARRLNPIKGIYGPTRRPGVH
jgi:hypothetical protein